MTRSSRWSLTFSLSKWNYLYIYLSHDCLCPAHSDLSCLGHLYLIWQWKIIMSSSFWNSFHPPVACFKYSQRTVVTSHSTGNISNQNSQGTGAAVTRDVLCSPVLCSTQPDWARCYQHNETWWRGDSFPAGWLHNAHCLQEINSSHLYTRESVEKRRSRVTSLLKVQYAARDLLYK
jgi:hypothetical protein